MAEGLERVAVSPYPTVAAMWQEALRREGIVAMVRNRDALSTAYGVQAAPFACELLVPAGQAEAARELLEEIGAGAPDDLGRA
jgi:hypothetical protein